MGFTLWLCALCLQASLLSHALDCATAAAATQGELRADRRTADRQFGDQKQQGALPLTEELVLSRRKRQLERRGPTHLSQTGLPGSVSVKGFPNTLIQQADRSRRHLVQVANKKKNKRKSRVGSFSLLTNDMKANPLQVIRARRQVKPEPPKRNSGRSGAFSVLGDPQNDGQNDRPKRSTMKTKKATKQ